MQGSFQHAHQWLIADTGCVIRILFYAAGEIINSPPVTPSILSSVGVEALTRVIVISDLI